MSLLEQKMPEGWMSKWHREWCTTERVMRFLQVCKNDIAVASDTLAQALLWRDEHKDILTGARVPRWQTDFRVLTRGHQGHPIIYGCFRYARRNHTVLTVQDFIEHMVAVLESASQSRRKGASRCDVVLDCEGFAIANHLEPTPVLALMRMVNAPYRDGLRFCIIVDAPGSFQMLWRMAAPLLGTKTKAKVHFVSRAEAKLLLNYTSGVRAALAVAKVMDLNRTPEGCPIVKLPSELIEEPGDGDGDGDGDEADAAAGCRPQCRPLVEPLPLRSEAQASYRKVDEDKTQPKPWHSWLCCRRRAEEVRFKHVHFEVPDS